MTMRLGLLALAAATLLAAPKLDAQVVVAGQRSVRVNVTLGLVIPPRLLMRSAAAPVLVATAGDTATYRLDVEVAANLHWTLRVGATDATQQVRVRDAEGAWRVVTDAAATVVTDDAPAYWRPVAIEYQVVGVRGPAPVPALSVQLAPSRR